MKARLLAFVFLLSVMPAYADSIQYTINFQGDIGPLPTGSFRYDSAAQLLTEFTVRWNDIVEFNPKLEGIQGVVPCLGGKTGDAAVFALLRGDCTIPGRTTRWDLGPAAADNAYFYFLSQDLPAGNYISVFGMGGIAKMPALRSGTWTITPAFAVPEPASWLLLAAGIAAAGIRPMKLLTLIILTPMESRDKV